MQPKASIVLSAGTCLLVMFIAYRKHSEYTVTFVPSGLLQQDASRKSFNEKIKGALPQRLAENLGGLTREYISVQTTEQMKNIEDLKFENSKRWIILDCRGVTNPDVGSLVSTNWTVLVVEGSPKNCRLPKCFDSIVNQLNLKTTNAAYSKWNIAHEFAIAHGAEIIYNVRLSYNPAITFKRFTYTRDMTALKFDETGLFNPYLHFGQPSLIPLAHLKPPRNVSAKYKLGNWTTPSIQSIISGSIDSPPEGGNTILKVAFDTRAPPVIVPAGVFAPLQWQNTLYLYDALWSLFVPTTTSPNLSDLWRGYWQQRLLWEIDATVGLLSPTSKHEEVVEYTFPFKSSEHDQTKNFISYLQDWTCPKNNTFFFCVLHLSASLFGKNFWTDNDVLLMKSWLDRLKTVGYREPVRVGSWKKRANKKKGSDENVVLYSASEQPSPFLKEEHKFDMKGYTERIASYCNTTLYQNDSFHFNYPNSKEGLPVLKPFPQILLIVVFNFPHYKNVEFLEDIYNVYFPHIIYCGTTKSHGNFTMYAQMLRRKVSFLEAPLYNGYLGQICLVEAMQMGYDVDGYLYIGDDTLISPWNIQKQPLNKLWFNGIITTLEQSKNFTTNWVWYKSFLGLPVYQRAINDSKHLDQKRFGKFFETLEINSGIKGGFFKGLSDIAFVPRRYKKDFHFFMEYFTSYKLFLEIAFPTVFRGIELTENIYTLPGRYLGYDGSRRHYARLYDNKTVFIHPVKVGETLNNIPGRTFYCERYLPYFFNQV